ncbi:MAG: dihydroorotase, partial [Confluentibacter sp.]|nr:dihydroorotase [Confluentibacter sp.]
IDMVTSDHNPMDIEHKKIEFDHAAFGTIGLESAFAALQTIFTTKKTIDVLTRGKSRFGLEQTPINIGNKLHITLFNPDLRYTFSAKHILSKSKNAIFENASLKGSVYGIISNNQMALNN